MIRRTGKAWLAGAMGLLAAVVPAAAEQWPDHEFFFVRSKLSQQGRAVCEMELSLTIKDRLFALIWVETEDGPAPLIVNYMNADSKIALAERVVVTIDGAEILAFAPFSRSVEPEITTLAGSVAEKAAAHAWEAMQQAAEKATWLTVGAGDTTTRVPAKGLREALADFGECRRQRSL
jgi:hypothetical protein